MPTMQCSEKGVKSLDMSLNDQTPVLVGAGAVTQREKDPLQSQEAVALMVEAARRAAVDAGGDARVHYEPVTAEQN